MDKMAKALDALLNNLDDLGRQTTAESTLTQYNNYKQRKDEKADD